MAADPMDDSPMSQCSRINLRMHRLRLKQRTETGRKEFGNPRLWSPNAAHSGLAGIV